MAQDEASRGMTQFPDPKHVQLTKDVLAADGILTQYRVIIDGMAFDDTETYQKLVTELVEWKNK